MHVLHEASIPRRRYESWKYYTWIRTLSPSTIVSHRSSVYFLAWWRHQFTVLLGSRASGASNLHALLGPLLLFLAAKAQHHLHGNRFEDGLTDTCKGVDGREGN